MRIQSSRIWIHDQFVAAQLEITARRIWTIQPYNSHNCDYDFGDCMIVPGFIDIHTHGAYGFDTNDAKTSNLLAWAKKLPSEGVTGFLPTIVTDSTGRTSKALKSISEAIYKQELGIGSKILGAHMEGPYISKDYCGAHPKSMILSPSIPQLRDFQRTAEGCIRLITMAPETDKGHNFINYCAHNGILVSIGHTGATYEEALAAVNSGASSVTHTFNAMSPLHHRENGTVGLALEQSSLYSEIIGDCHHVNPEVINLFFKCKDAYHGILVSDSLRCKGAPIGDRFLFADQACYIAEDGTARIAQSNRLAGSTMKMNEGLRNLINVAGVDPIKAIHATSLNPATLLGIDDRVGKIQPEYDADLTILDHNFNVVNTICKGSLQL